MIPLLVRFGVNSPQTGEVPINRFDEHLRARLIAFVSAIALVCGLALGAGFVWFANGLEMDETVQVPHAEGIVALTGGSERISDAVELIASGHAERMLISGVNQSTSGAEIARLTPGLRSWFDCCIDLGYGAINTIGNAVEARRWAQQHGIHHSLIIVTSNYHMPRAMLEISRAMPDMALVPHAVVSDKMREGVWSDPQVTRLVAMEYLKYIAAWAGMRRVPAPDNVTEPLDAHPLAQPAVSRHAAAGR